MRKIPACLALISTLPAAALAAGEHAGGHHGEEHGGGHHGPHDWNAPPEAAARPNPVAADAESIARGDAVYDQHCVVCHGPAGAGDGPLAASLDPPPPNLQVMAPLHPPGDLAWKIAEGRGAMPAWKATLSEAQIWDTVNYLKSLDAGAAGGHDDHHHGSH